MARDTALTVVEKEPQAGLFDKLIIDKELYKLVVEMEAAREKIRAYNRDRKKYREAFSLMPDLHEGDRVMIKENEEAERAAVFEVKKRSGGGHEIGTWTRLLPGQLSFVDL